MSALGASAPRPPAVIHRDALADALVEAFATEYGRRLDLDDRDAIWRAAEYAAPRALSAYLIAYERATGGGR